MKRYLPGLLALLMAASAHAQINAPTGQTYDQALMQARKQAHHHAEKLDSMTEDQWRAFKQTHPGRHPMETLAQARQQVHRHEAKLDNMTPLQYQNWTLRHPKFGGMSPASGE